MVGYMPFRLGGRRCGISVAAECIRFGSDPKSCAACLVGSLCAVWYCTTGGPLVSDAAGTCNCARSCAWSSVPGGGGAADDVEAVGFTSSPRTRWWFFLSVFFLVGGMI